MFGLTDRGRRIIRLRLFLPKTTTFARFKKKKKKQKPRMLFKSIYLKPKNVT